jgi:hypothetical protein
MELRRYGDAAKVGFNFLASLVKIREKLFFRQSERFALLFEQLRFHLRQPDNFDSVAESFSESVDPAASHASGAYH